jgi:hypothetical protein
LAQAGGYRGQASRRPGAIQGGLSYAAGVMAAIPSAFALDVLATPKRRRGWGAELEAYGKTYERVDILRRSGHPNIHACVDLDVLDNPVGQTDVHRAYPRAAAA